MSFFEVYLKMCKKDPRPITHDSIVDNLASLAKVIGRDAKLRKWFRELDKKPFFERRSEILQMAEQMTSERKDMDAVAAFKLLADPKVFGRDAVGSTRVRIPPITIT